VAVVTPNDVCACSLRASREQRLLDKNEASASRGSNM
jgi:hypothetical protein